MHTHLPTNLHTGAAYEEYFVIGLFYTWMIVLGVGFGPYVAVGYVAQILSTIALVTTQLYGIFLVGGSFGLGMQNADVMGKHLDKHMDVWPFPFSSFSLFSLLHSLPLATFTLTSLPCI